MAAVRTAFTTARNPKQLALQKTDREREEASVMPGKILLREFLTLASTALYKADDVWENLRQITTPNKYKNVVAMFKRWSELVKHNKGGK